MHRFIKIFDIRGLKGRLLAAGLGLNLLLTFLLFTGVVPLLNQDGDWIQNLPILLMVGILLLSSLVGMGVTLVAQDQRGPSYGVLGGLGAFMLVIVFMYPSGLLATIIALTALLGGYNGGIIGENILNRTRKNS